MKTTIIDIAKAAGVSIATVSRVLNELPGVKQETKEKVWQVMKQLDYQSAITAPTVSKKSKVIGLLVPNIKNPFYSEVAEGIYSMVLNKGLIVITLSLLAHDIDAVLRLLDQYSIDTLLAMDISKEMIDAIADKVEDIVLIGNDYFDGKTNCVVIDNFLGVQLVMQHLFQAGHKRIAMLSEPSVYNDIRERIRAYQFCMDEAGLSDNRLIMYADGPGIEDGERIGSSWTKQGMNFTAVLVSNDMLAIGLMKALRTAEISVPDDISIAGFDGTWASSIVTPSMTSVVQPMFEMGTTAISLITDLNPSSTPKKIVLKPTLQMGGTVKRLIPPVNLN
ncbi:LacI family DNA-binding transcriptional regulator [Paenibacillus cremeus]|uniref:LacI family transcriptional regulator n=1 Tax=Paenibacillus cremeus TaxID=2163881 RepID=A0A559JKE0_9BACL|nr:LacI family DNA-binding transcriptional regulator [Paenibacillus cremeus]TVY00330.1 LacI family transcriptional regulator [Paenibacillus cremeus]